MNHLRDDIWSNHGGQTAFLEIEFSLLKFAVSIRRSVYASKLVLSTVGYSAHFHNRFRSLSNVNRSGFQNANKNAAAAAEKTESSNGVLMPRPVAIPIANSKRRRPERKEANRVLKPAMSNSPKSVSAAVAAHANDTVHELGKRDVTAPVYFTK